MPARLLACLLTCAALAAPGVAVAQQDPFGPIPQSPPEQAPAPAPAAEDEGGDDGLDRWQELLIAGAGIVLLFGIGYAIVRDARAAAPAGARTGLTETGERSKGTRPPPKQRVASQRTKAKAARRARKRNR